MKKIKLLLLAVIIAAPTFSAFADDEDKTKGIRAGWQTSNFYDENESFADPYNSFYVGFFGEKSIVPLLKFGSGIEYNSTGTQIDSDNRNVRHVIGIPLYLKLKLGPVYALGGAGFNFQVAQKVKLLGQDVDLDSDDRLKTFNLPLFAGVGVNILMFRVEARYHWGMTNLSKDSNFTTKNQYFQLGAAIAL